MTKRVRIENADAGTHFKVVVEIWDKGTPGTETTPPGPDTLANTIHLDNPADMTGMDVYLTSTRYLVVKEA